MNARVDVPAPRWWSEGPFWLIIVALSAVFLLRLGDIPLRGEEHGWIEVAAEMRHFDDWVVPRLHGEAYRTRPPLHPWLIAGSEAIIGPGSRSAARLPSTIAVILTACVLYAYSRHFFSRAGAVTAALAYPTFGEVVTHAQQAETEPVYVLFISASLLLWHLGYIRQWRAWATWSIAYGLAAAACLCKGGLQPPVYLCGTIGVYLLWKRNLSYLFTRGHLVGLVVGVGVAAAWAVPCAQIVGWETTKAIWMSDTSNRFVGWTPGLVFGHLGRFPLEAFTSLLPWSLLGLAFVLPGVRRTVVENRACVGFCALAFGLAWLTIWIPPGGKTRYLAPLYPCLAVVLAAVADAAAAPAVGRAWQRFLVGVVVMLVGIAVAVGAARFVLLGRFAEACNFSLLHTVIYAALLLGLAAALMALRRNAVRAAGAGAWLVAAGTVLVLLGPLTDYRIARTNDLSAVVAPLRAQVLMDQPLIALGYAHPSVPLFLGRVASKEYSPTAIPPGAYFCIDLNHGVVPQFPFAWEEVARVSVNRHHDTLPGIEVLIGRRLPAGSP